MVTKSKLKLALAAEKGVDFKKIKEKRKVKAALKAKKETGKSKSNGRAAAVAHPEEDEDEDEWEDDDEDEGSDDEEEGDGLLDLEAEESGSDEDDEDDDEDGEENTLDLGALDDSDLSDSEVEMEQKIARPKATAPAAKKAKGGEKKDRTSSKKANAADNEDGEEDDDEDEEDEDEEDIPMSDLEDLPDEEKDDLIRHQRLTINNTTALLASLKRIALPTDSSVPFATHMCVVSSQPTEADIPDVADDLNRELALYKQSLEAAKRARALLRAEKVPFSRPGDYFAEMLKPDEHMEKVKAKLVEDATAKKAAAEARKLRDLKKFGKQVQVAKMQERAKAKKDTLEKIKSLKRKRQESSAELPAREADLFDVGVDSELKSHKGSASGRKSAGAGSRGGEPNRKRQKKNEKYGFGGKKRNSKSGDAMSSGDLSGFSARKMKGKPGGGGGKAPRPGKSKRKAMAGRR